MFFKMTRLSRIGMMVFLAPLALAGCLAPEGDEIADDESATDESATDESATEPKINAVCFGTHEDRKIETCQSGWPGTRTYVDTITSQSDIVEGTIDVSISGVNGEVRHSATQSGARQINFSATVREGGIFSPGQNTTTYSVSWCRR